MNIQESIGQEAVLLGISVLLGAALFLIYDVLRIFRRIFPHGTIWIGIEDFFYWILCTAAVFVMLYRENDGMVRGFSLGGVVIGMALYYFLLSRFVIQILVKILRTILGFFCKTGSVLFSPFRRVGGKIFHFIKKRLKKIVKAIKIGISKR